MLGPLDSPISSFHSVQHPLAAPEPLWQHLFRSLYISFPSSHVPETGLVQFTWTSNGAFLPGWTVIFGVSPSPTHPAQVGPYS